MSGPTIPFGVGRDNDPVAATEQHLNDTLARHPVTGPTDLGKHRLFKQATEDIQRARARQSDYAALGNAKAAQRCQLVIEIWEDVRRGLTE